MADAMELGTFWTLSTAHLTESDVALLQQAVEEYDFTVAIYLEGFWVHSESYLLPMISKEHPELWRILRDAHERKIDYVRFDSDGPVVWGYPTFEQVEDE